jgi:pimeloyl-ACP methyl ester carboxylesterase
VACKDLETLRGLRRHASVVTNARTGHSLEYVVIGDGAKSDKLVLMFNGTGGIYPDWPIQMLTNGASSPEIVRTGVYSRDDEAAVSLCHDYRLVLFDYPGVGATGDSGFATFDQIADDVDAMLGDISTRYGLSTSRISLVGWSLGTLAALKYAFLSPSARPERELHEVVLIASKAGGAVDGFADGNGAQCVTTFFEALKKPDLDKKLELEIKGELFKLLYPYEKQQPYNGLDSGCSATIDAATHEVSLNVEPNGCKLGSQCGKQLADYVLNRVTSPWVETHGVSPRMYTQQRELVFDWNHCYCATPGAGFKSAGCSCSKTPQLTDTNGGVCQSKSGESTRNAPSSFNCVPLKLQGQLTVINGPQDLFIQWTYGKALVEAYQEAYGKDKASLVVYDGPDGAGHGVLVQHPRWVQERIHAALQEHPSNP